MLRPTKIGRFCANTLPRFISSAKAPHDRLNLKGRVAIVTGGTRGIGLAIAKRLEQYGAHVVISSRKQPNVDDAVHEMKDEGFTKVSGIACHFSKDEERAHLWEKTLKDHGEINIMVQNAGVNIHPYGIMTTPSIAIDKTCDLHIKANFKMIQEIAPTMSKGSYPGSIVLTSSVVSYCSNLYPGIYAVTKGGVMTMTRAFAGDLVQSNIRINCVCLGAIDTEFLSDEVRKEDTARNRYLGLTPLNRFGKPEECAGIVAYLASDDASYVTGETFSVQGGLYTRP